MASLEIKQGGQKGSVLHEWRSKMEQLKQAMILIEQLLPSSAIDPGVLKTLLRFYSQGRIKVRFYNGDKAQFNGLTKQITLNSKMMNFLRFDFAKRCEQLKAKGEVEMLQKLEDVKMITLFELTGVLIHEGQHAFRPIRSLFFPRKAQAADEGQAFASEQLWYQCLDKEFGQRYGKELRILAKQAEEDAKTALTYAGLNLSARSLLV